jgi:hypothetical protein
MIAVEIGKSIPSAKIIIVSSAKTQSEIPFYLKMFRYFPVYKVLPHRSVKKSLFIQEYFLGVQSVTTRKYIKEAVDKADVIFYKWAVGAILTWENKVVPLNIIHIHGEKDKLLPHKFVKPDISVANGGHLMIMENAYEISVLLKEVLLRAPNAENG